MIRIKRKRLIHCWDESLIDNPKKYTGFIFYSAKKCKVTDKNRLLIHFSSVFLKEDKFPMIEDDITQENLYSCLKETFKLDSSLINNTGLIYNIPNIKLYIIHTKFKTKIDYNGFSWKQNMEFYKINEINDLYENILNVNNSYFNNKIFPENNIKLSFKLKQIYKFMIGYNTTH